MAKNKAVGRTAETKTIDSIIITFPGLESKGNLALAPIDTPTLYITRKGV